MRKRARTKKGRYRADNKSTIQFNEAWIVRPAIWLQIKKQCRKFTKWWRSGFYGLKGADITKRK